MTFNKLKFFYFYLRRVFLPIYRGSKYTSGPSIKEKNFKSILRDYSKHKISIHKPYKEKSHLVSKFSKKYLDLNYVKYRTAYYENIAFNILSNKIESITKKKYQKFWKNYNFKNKSKHIKKLKELIGYNEDIKINHKPIKVKKINNNIKKITFADISGTQYNTIHALPKKNIKGLVIALHGTFSDPETILGLNSNEDYSRSFGKYWFDQGFEIFAPEITWDKTRAFNLFPLQISSIGLDLLKIKQIIEYTNKIKRKKIPVIIIGISHGALIAKFAGIIFNEIKCLVEIAASISLWDKLSYLRNNVAKEKLYRNVSNSIKNSQVFSPSYYLYFQNIDLYKLFAPKPIVISQGILNHQYGINYYLNVFKYYKKIGLGNKCILNIFDGGHESYPEGEFNSYLRLFKKK